MVAVLRRGGRRGLSLGGSLGARHDHTHPVTQPIAAVDDHSITQREARIDRRRGAVGRTEADRPHRHRVVGIDQIDVGARRPALDRRRRHGGNVVQRAHQQLGIHKLVRKQRVVGIFELRTHLHGAGGRVDLAVERDHASGRQKLDIGAVVGRDLERGAGIQLRHDLRQVVLGDRKDHSDRLHLRDHRDSGVVAGLHVVSRIDKAKADTAGDRRYDAAVEHVELLLIDLRLIELHRALVLLHDVDLILVLLARYRILLGKFLVAYEVDLRLRQQALIVGELAFELRLQKLVGPRIDLRQEIALLDQLPFGEPDLQELAVDLRLHGNGGDRGDGAQRVDDDPDVALSDCCGTHRLGRQLPPGGLTAGARPRDDLVGGDGETDEDDQPDADANSGAAAPVDARRRRRSAQLRDRLVISSARPLVHLLVRSFKRQNIWSRTGPG